MANDNRYRRGFLKSLITGGYSFFLSKNIANQTVDQTTKLTKSIPKNGNILYSSLADLKSAHPREQVYNLVAGTPLDGTFFFETADAPYASDNQNVITLDTVDPAKGALVRQKIATISTEDGQNAQAAIDRVAKFDHVSDLLADRSQVWASDQIIRAGSHRYRVLPPDSNDHHLVTDGGTKLTVLPTGDSIALEALAIDLSGKEDSTQKLRIAGIIARQLQCGISCGLGRIKISGNRAVDWQGIHRIDCAAELIRDANSSTYVVVGGNSSSTIHSFFRLSAYDVSDQFGIDRKKPELLRLQGLKHFDLQGRISKVLCFADGAVLGAESGGYGKINADVYTLEIRSINGGWFNHVHVYSERLVKLLLYRSDGSYKINGWTIEGLFELANAEIDLDHVSDLKIRGRFETTPSGFIKLRKNTANILIINSNSNGNIQPWYQNWRSVWLGLDEGINNRVIHEAHIGLDHRVLAHFHSDSVVSDGQSHSLVGTGVIDSNVQFQANGVTFIDSNSYVIVTPWILAKRGDIFSSNADADEAWCRPCIEIMSVADGSIPVQDPKVVEHAFNKYPKRSAVWAYTGKETAGAAAGSYYTIKAQKGFDAFLYSGPDGEYYVRMVLRVFSANSAVVRSAALWCSGRDFGTREMDLIKTTDRPALLSKAPMSPAPMGTSASDGNKIWISEKYEITALKTKMFPSDDFVALSRYCPSAAINDMIAIELDNGSRHLTTVSSITKSGAKIRDRLPSNASPGRWVWIGSWV